MSDKIEILLADDIAETRSNIKKLIELEENLQVISEAADGREAIEKAKKIKPDIILMDINMPDIDGIKATEIINREVPGSSIIMMSVQEEQNYLRKAMMVGAREYLIKPFGDDELINTIKQVHELEKERQSYQLLEEDVDDREGKVISVFSSKGGVGKTLLANNLAVYLQQYDGVNVALVDLDLQFGDVSVMLDLTPRITILDVINDIPNIDSENIDDYLLDYDNGLKVLASPLRPEEAEMINANQIKQVFEILKEKFDYIIVDTAQSFSEKTLISLDCSDLILLIAMLDLPTIKNVRLCLEVMDNLNYPEEKIKLIVNRSSQEVGINVGDLEENLNYTVDIHVPSEGEVTIDSINQGVPFVISKPQSRISKKIAEMADLVTGAREDEPQDKEGWLKKIGSFLNS
jgi:pilus assembly protein CpaE